MDVFHNDTWSVQERYTDPASSLHAEPVLGGKLLQARGRVLLMSTLETIAVVAIVYILVFIAHRTTADVASDDASY